MDSGNMSSKSRKRCRKAHSDRLASKEAYDASTQIVKPLPGLRRVEERLRKAKAKAKKLEKAIANVNQQVTPPRRRRRFSKSRGAQVKLFFKSANLHTLLTPENMVQLKEAILDVMVKTKSNVLPQFEECTPLLEWMQLVCANKRTADWVKQNFSAIRRASKLDIELMQENQVPKNIIKGCFPNSSKLSDDKVLALIAAQNPLKTRKWKILYRAVSGNNLYLAMGVDDKSFKSLTSSGGRISYCFGRISLILNVAGDDLSEDAASNSDSSLQLPNDDSCNEWDMIIDKLDAEDEARKDNSFSGNKRDGYMSTDSSY